MCNRDSEKERNREIRHIKEMQTFTHTHINGSTINVEMKSAQSSVQQNPWFFLWFMKRREIVSSQTKDKEFILF